MNNEEGMSHATQEKPGHHYSVYIAAYADEATKLRVEQHEEDFTQPGRIIAHSFYSDGSQALAERAFSRACLAAMRNPLAFEVVMQRDSQTIIKVKAER
jgi:hypothetical protein